MPVQGLDQVPGFKDCSVVSAIGRRSYSTLTNFVIEPKQFMAMIRTVLGHCQTHQVTIRNHVLHETRTPTQHDIELWERRFCEVMLSVTRVHRHTPPMCDLQASRPIIAI